MAGFKSEISVLKGFRNSRQKKRSKAENEEAALSQEAGISEAIDALEGDSFGFLPCLRS